MIDERSITREDMIRLQEEAWAAAYAHAYAHSPFYRNHFSGAGLSEHTPLPLDEIHRIPMVDKAVLSEHNLELLAVPRENVIDIVTTSGTTGEPWVAMLTEKDLQRLGYNEYQSFQCVGLSPSDTVILAVTLDRCFIAGMAYFLGLRQTGCSIVRGGPSTPQLHLDLLERLHPTAIVSVPSFLKRLAETAEGSGSSIASSSVCHLVCIGEPVRNEDFKLNSTGEYLEEHWGAKVYSTYGNTELASSLCECGAGRGGHLHPELLHVDIVGDDGNILPEGTVGEIVATALGIEGMPVIRYATGDCAALFREPCPCGRQTPRLGPIVGRKGQKLKVKGTTLFPATLQSVMESTPGIDAYVIVASSHDPLSDTVEILFSTTRPFDEAADELRASIQGRAKVLPELRQATVEEIESMQMPDNFRKRRFFIDNR